MQIAKSTMKTITPSRDPITLPTITRVDVGEASLGVLMELGAALKELDPDKLSSGVIDLVPTPGVR
jgi:hypothetical protein